MPGFAWPLASSSAAWGGLWGPGPQPRPWGDPHVPTPMSPSPGWGQAVGAEHLGDPLITLEHLSLSPAPCPCPSPWDTAEGWAVSLARFTAASPN